MGEIQDRIRHNSGAMGPEASIGDPMTPEQEKACGNYLEILENLSGAPKYNFFHMRHFVNGSHQDELWRRMAEADEEANQWRNDLAAEREAEWEKYIEEEQAGKKARGRIIEVGLGKLATHPNPRQKGRDSIGDYRGDLGGEKVFFRIIKSDSIVDGEDPILSIELPHPPVTLDPETIEDREVKNHLKWFMSGYGEIVNIGEVFRFLGEDHMSRDVIFDQKTNPAMDDFTDAHGSLNATKLPYAARLLSYHDTPSTIEQYIDLITEAEPVIPEQGPEA